MVGAWGAIDFRTTYEVKRQRSVKFSVHRCSDLGVAEQKVHDDAGIVWEPNSSIHIALWHPVSVKG